MPYPTHRSEASGIWKLNEISRALLGVDWPLWPIEYLVIAGGGGAGSNYGGGGGAGGYRTNYTSSAPTPSPKLSGGGGSIESALTITTGIAYTVTVGAGGAGKGLMAVGWRQRIKLRLFNRHFIGRWRRWSQ
jgi:hypothetical protein